MSVTLNARVHAPTAPLWQRVFFYFVGWAFIASGLVALNSFPIASTLLGIGVWILLVAPFFLHRRRTKTAQITTFPGHIVVRAPRSFPRTIRTRALRGAAVAKLGDRFVLTLAERYSPHSPISIEVDDERALKEIRKALGVRREGFGEVEWSLRGSVMDTIDVCARVLGAVTLGLYLIGMNDLPIVDIFPCAIALSMYAAATRLVRNEPMLALAPTRIDYRYRTGYRQRTWIERLRHEELLGVSDYNGIGVTLQRGGAAETQIRCEPVRWTRSGMRPEERAIMIAHLRTASARAHGEGALQSDDVFHVEQLQRGASSALDWLARIDALASTNDEAGYRSHSIAPEDLWSALESHDTQRDVRAAAARVLMRISPEKSQDRVAAALDSIHDDAERASVRAALDTDLDVAAKEIEALDEITTRRS